MERRERHAPLRGEEGFGLIEVLVSAVLVVVIATASLTALESSSRASGRAKSRTVGASLAQQDQDRLQQLGAVGLASLDQTRTVAVDGVDYTIRSQGQYVADDTQAPGCGSRRADYIRVITTVNWVAMNGAQPIRFVSTVRPPAGSTGAAQGSIALQVNNAAGVGIEGLTVSLTDGPAGTVNKVTEKGCAFFGDVPVGNYKLRYSRTGWVDREGNRDVVKAASASPEQVASYSGEYDVAGSIQADFKTRVTRTTGSTTTTTELPSKGMVLRLSQAGLAGGQRLFTPVSPATEATSISAANLYPFSSPYGLVSGSCASGMLPTAMAAEARTAGYATEQLVAPGTSYGGTAAPVKVLEPALDVRVMYPGPIADQPVYVYPRSCGGARMTFRTGPDGYLPNADLGLPYGTYDLCLDALVSGTTYNVRVNGVVNNVVNGKYVELPGSGASATGACPAS